MITRPLPRQGFSPQAAGHAVVKLPPFPCVEAHMQNPVPAAALLALMLSSSEILAHPNHQATQRTTVELVPATEPPSASARVSVTIEGDKRVITANGLPDHSTGRFPNADNPNRITSQN